MKKLLLLLVALITFTTTFAGTGTKEDPYTVEEIIAKNPNSTNTAVESDIYVKGYIVGNLKSGGVSSAEFGASSASSKSNLMLASSSTETSTSNCISIQLSSSNKEVLNLNANASNLGKEIIFQGDIMKYCGLPGIKNTTYYEFVETTPTNQTSTPKFDPIAGEIATNQAIEITCATEGAKIYYTTDDTEPSESSNLYSAPFTLSEECTVKAIAVSAGLDNSNVAEATYVFPCANIAKFLADASKFTRTIAGTVTVVAKGGNYMLVQDASDKMIVYSYDLADLTLNNGDQLSGIKGSYSEYHGIKQMSNPDLTTFANPVAGTAVEPTPATLADVTTANLLNYVKIEGVTISGTTATDTNGNSVTLKNNFGLAEIPTGENLTIVGVIGCYDATLQIWPVEVTTASGLEVCATPEFSVANGEVNQGTEVEITCATDGATIYYTINGGDILTYSDPIVIEEDCTIEAYASKEGMEDSGVATGEFTVKVFTTNGKKYRLITSVSELTTDGEYVFSTADGIAMSNEEASERIYGTEVLISSSILSSTDNVLTFSIAGDATSGWTWTATNYAGSNDKLNLNPNSTTMGIGTTATTTTVTIDADGVAVISASGNTRQIRYSTDYSYFRNYNATQSKTTGIQIYKLDSDLSGIEDVELNNNAAVEYYNLQGVRVAEPTSGLYIRRQGNTATKVLVK